MCPTGPFHKCMRTLKGFGAAAFLILMAAIAGSAQTTLAGLDGSSVNVQGQKGKVVVLAIGASWLPLSQQEAAFTTTLARKFAGRNVAIYFVFTDSNKPGGKNYASDDQLRSFAAQYKVGVQVLRDPDGAATLKKFQVEQVPSFVILDRSGALAGEPFGGIDPKFDVTVPISNAINGLF
jgi:thiol-disulfide isomerase/thioredoxin